MPFLQDTPPAPERQHIFGAMVQLQQAATTGDVAAIREALDVPGVDIDGVPEGQHSCTRSALQEAARMGHVGALAALIEGGANVNAFAASAGLIQAIRWTREPVTSAITPLAIAASQGHAAAVGVLLAAGAEPQLEEGEGGSPLHFAVRSKSLACVDALLAGGASATVTCGGARPDELPEATGAVRAALWPHLARAWAWGGHEVAPLRLARRDMVLLRSRVLEG